MAVIQIPGRVSGKNYSFNIAGDIPTPTEQGRIAQALQIEEEKFRRYYESNVGEPLAEPDDGTAIVRGIDRGLASAKNRLGTAQRFIGERTGLDFLKDYGAGVEDQGQYEQFLAQMAQPAPTERKDVKGLMSGLTYAGEQLGQTIPETGAVIAATGAGTLLGSPALGLTAGALTAAPTIFGGNIQRQEEEVKAGRKDNVDITAALIATVGQAAIESIADKFLVLGFLKPGQKLFSRTVGGLAEGAALEAPTEVAQQIIERAQAGLPLDDDAAMQEYIDSAIAGGIVGSSIRGPTAMLGIGAGAPATTAPTQTEEELAAQDEARLARIAAAEETVLAAAPEPISPEGTDQGELFPTAEQAPRLAEPTVQELMDTLQIPKAAPIRKRLRDFTPNAPEVLTALEKHQRQPGIKAETKAAIKDFLATQTVAAPAVATAQTVKAPDAANGKPIANGDQSSFEFGKSVVGQAPKQIATTSTTGVTPPKTEAVGSNLPLSGISDATEGLQPNTLTPEAEELLAAADKGAPSNINVKMREIARDNGVVIERADTPAMVIDKLKAKKQVATPIEEVAQKLNLDTEKQAAAELQPAPVPAPVPATALDELEYNKKVRERSDILDRDTISENDNILYRPERAYRFIGTLGYADFLKSGFIRPAQNTKQAYDAAYFMKGKSSGRYGRSDSGAYIVETTPVEGAWRNDDASVYITPNSPLTKDDKIRIYKRKEDGSFEVVLDNIGDRALLPAQPAEEQTTAPSIEEAKIAAEADPANKTAPGNEEFDFDFDEGFEALDAARRAEKVAVDLKVAAEREAAVKLQDAPEQGAQLPSID